VLQSFGAISGPAVQAMVSAGAGPDRQGETQGALASLQGLTAIVSPLAAGWLFGAFTEPAAPVYFPGAPFLMSVLTYLAAFAAIRGLPRDLAWVQPRRA
jgi:DHA1 family tetracycline resistance protein-like MFS transporter